MGGIVLGTLPNAYLHAGIQDLDVVRSSVGIPGAASIDERARVVQSTR